MLRIVFICILFLLGGCATSVSHCPTPLKPAKALRFVTYNVFWKNGSQNPHNPQSINHIIKSLYPDIVVLQETYCFSKNHLDRAFRCSHPYQLLTKYHEGDIEDGLGILSRYPIIYHRYFPAVYGWFPGWLFIIKTPQGCVQVLNVHLNPKLVCGDNIGIFLEGLWATPKFRSWEIAYYHRYLNPFLPTIIAGDFNENDGGRACHFLRNHCFNDMLLNHVPYPIKTWHYPLGGLTFTGRYDRIYTSKVLPLYTQVVSRGYSDHFPVLLDFKID